MESSSVTVGNVQPHSAGEVFPFVIEVTENALTGIGFIQACNHETGVYGARWHYVRKGEGFQSFREAHKAAEYEAKRLLELERKAVTFGKAASKAARERLRRERTEHVQQAIESILSYRGYPA